MQGMHGAISGRAWQHHASIATAVTTMSEYSAELVWQRRSDETFVDKRYSRRHELRFDGGAIVAASSAPGSVPLPYSDATAVDPEEMFIAALSSCHALWFLSLAANAGFVVDHYSDHADGTLASDAHGKTAMTRVTLRPRVTFGGDNRPGAEQHAALHREAHRQCFIANSVLTDVRCEPELA